MNRQQRTGFIHWIMRIGSIAIRTSRDKNAALRIEMFICSKHKEGTLPIPTRELPSGDTLADLIFSNTLSNDRLLLLFG